MYSLTISLSREDMAKIRQQLYLNISWGWEERDNQFVIHFTGHDQARDLAELARKTVPDCETRIRPVQNVNWNEEWKQYFTPVCINDTFIILPDWLEHTPTDLIKIVITPKMAFGTGHHPTTRLCLKALSSLSRQGIIDKDWKFLDLGTGSGILGIAAARLGLTGICLDIDRIAVENTLENAAGNKVQDRLEIRTGDVFSINRDTRINMVIANILSSTLKELADQIVSLLDMDDFCLILSGILKTQVDEVVKTYAGKGLASPEVFHEQEWSVLVWTSRA